ncbi:MAG TPA: hypothetical protein VEH07_05400, partial [Alphaproteobacteria bacterium]|nr:hypothetical protein [Alphaproteobacteria bacterium]
DGHVWAERYDRDLNDIFALQDEISEAIVKALKLKLLPEEKKAIEDRGTKNLEAYDFYLRGNSVYAQMGYENTIRAAELLRNALALDPAFSLARRSLARILRVLIYVTPVDRTSARQELEDLIEGGILEAKDLALSHYWRGVQNMRRHDWFGAEQAFDRSISLSPGSETGLIDSRRELLQYVGRMTDAIDLGRELVRNDPLSLIQSSWLQATLSALGRASEEEIEFERTRTLSGDHMAIELTRLQRIWPDSAPAERRNQLQRILASGVFTSGYVLRLEDVFDQPNAARGVLRQAFADLRDKAVTDVMRIALLAGLFSDIELALDCLNRAYVDLDFPEGNRLWAPAFAEARKRPRFKDLIRELGIYDYWRKSGKWGDFARAKGDDDFEITR